MAKVLGHRTAAAFLKLSRSSGCCSAALWLKRGKKAARMRYVAFACHAPLRDFCPPPCLGAGSPPISFYSFMHELLSCRLALLLLPALFGIRCLMEHMALVCGINFMPLHFVGRFWVFSFLFLSSGCSPKWPLQNWFVWSPKALKFPSGGICFCRSC